jgi:hypothetical protein
MHKFVFFCCGLAQFCKSTTKEPFHCSYVICNHSCAHPTHESKRKDLKDFLWLSKCLRKLYYDEILLQEIQNKFPNPSHIQFLVFSYSITWVFHYWIIHNFLTIFKHSFILMNDFHIIGCFFIIKIISL